jgi:hypothetical protein
MIATATTEAVSLLNRRFLMPTNCLAQLLVTTRRDSQRHQEQTAPRNQSNILARLLVTTRDVTSDDYPRVLRHCDFPDSSAPCELQMAA